MASGEVDDARDRGTNEKLEVSGDLFNARVMA